MVDHTLFLTKMRWDAVMGNLKELTDFCIDSIHFSFAEPMSNEEINQFCDFLGNSNHMNSISPTEFCSYFRERGIKFSIKFRYSSSIPLMQNLAYFCLIWKLKKQTI